MSIIRERAQLPPPLPGQPGPFSLGSPGVLRQALTEAGFVDAEELVLAAPLRLPSAAECVRFERESFGALHQMLAGLDERCAGRRLGARSSRRCSASRVPTASVGPCELVIAAARRRP